MRFERESSIDGSISLKQFVVTIHYGDRIGQLVISQVFRPVIEIKLALEDTERGVGSFGSTGI
ncbi:MAG: hypothetical protein LBT86_07920 [Deltaproteobacteria bacterium]|jgi:dUTPase|nr:hypothetical protein [Deltaproteobacteria bacterium]